MERLEAGQRAIVGSRQLLLPKIEALSVCFAVWSPRSPGPLPAYFSRETPLDIAPRPTAAAGSSRATVRKPGRRPSADRRSSDENMATTE